jgi:hypothetical protein
MMTERSRMKGTNMKRAQAVSGYQIARQSIALTLSVLLIPFASGNLFAQAPYTPLDAPGLDQLVAPIALYPDSLVAQILTAATYPQQVADADNWSHQNAGLPPQARADQANGMPWDPSVKALTAFPTVLDSLARNTPWMTSLGNAYYNQPGDVMNAVQAARVQAQQSGFLRTTAQQRVYVDGGQILIAPVNPALVYVPYYNPWAVYGAGWVSPWGGYYLAPGPPGWAVGLGIGFFAGISIGLFAHYGWGWGSWAPNWRGGPVFYNHAAYYSRSATVFNHGHFGGYNRGVFEHAGRGVPAGFHPGATRASFAREGAGRPGGVRAEGARGPAGRPAGRPEGRPAGRPAGRPEAGRAQAARSEARPAGRPAGRPAAAARPAGGGGGARPQAHAAAARPSGGGGGGHAAPAAHGGGGGGGHKK